MRFSIPAAVALLAASSSALAQMPPPRHYDSRVDNGDGAFHPADDASAVDGPGNGLQLELDVFRLSTTYSTNNVFTTGLTGLGTTTGVVAASLVSTLQPLVLVGYQLSQNAFLLGIGVATYGVGGATGGGGSSTTYFGVSPTYRRYLSPLQTGRVDTFIEGGVTFSIAMPSGGATSPFGFGADVGGGAEWLFVRNFGLFGKALVSYGHVNLPTGGGAYINFDAAGLEGDVGLALHL